MLYIRTVHLTSLTNGCLCSVACVPPLTRYGVTSNCLHACNTYLLLGVQHNSVSTFAAPLCTSMGIVTLLVLQLTCLPQAAKAAGDKAQADNGGQIPPHPGFPRRIPSTARLSDLALSPSEQSSASGSFWQLSGAGHSQRPSAPSPSRQLPVAGQPQPPSAPSPVRDHLVAGRSEQPSQALSQTSGKVTSPHHDNTLPVFRCLSLVNLHKRSLQAKYAGLLLHKATAFTLADMQFVSTLNASQPWLEMCAASISSVRWAYAQCLASLAAGQTLSQQKHANSRK